MNDSFLPEMWEGLQRLFSTQGFMPHIHCYLAEPALVWTMFTTDFLIGASYISISLSLYALVRKIKLPFHATFLAFGLFIFACGATHFMEIYTLWTPAYWVAAAIKAVTALASVATAVALFPLRKKIVEFAEAAKLSEERHVQLGQQFEILQKSEERFRLLIDAVKDYAIFVLDPEGRVETWNQGARRLNLYEAEEIVGKHFSIFYRKEDVEAGKPETELRVAAAEGRFEDEGWRLRKDGSRFWANVIVTPLLDSDGKLRGFSKVTRDLTERKKTEDAMRTLNESLERRVKERTLQLEKSEEALRESEAQLRQFADSMPQLAWIARADGFIIWYNKGWYEYTGTSPKQMEGWGWQKVHHPDHLPRVMENWQASIDSGSPFEMEFPLRAADGTFRWFLTRGTPVRNPRGEIIRWFGTNTNVDEQKRALEERDQALKTARQAIAVRDEFLSIASHELKTPITSLRLQMQMTQRNLQPDKGIFPTPDKLARVLQISTTQIDRLNALIDDLLDVSMLGSGRITKRFATVDLVSLVREAADRHVEQIRSAGSSLEIHVPENPLMVECDASRIDQVVTNLLSNAAKYGAGKPIVLTLRQSGEKAQLIVSDQGLGIPEEKQSIIFERFERAVSSRNISGLGLGLYISREIIQAHSGSISVTSQPGKGSAFLVEVPLRQPIRASASL